MSNAPTDPGLQRACSAPGLGSSLPSGYLLLRLSGNIHDTAEATRRMQVPLCGFSLSSAVFRGASPLPPSPREPAHTVPRKRPIDLIERSVQIKQIEHSGTGIFLLWRQVAEAESSLK